MLYPARMAGRYNIIFFFTHRKPKRQWMQVAPWEARGWGKKRGWDHWLWRVEELEIFTESWADPLTVERRWIYTFQLWWTIFFFFYLLLDKGLAVLTKRQRLMSIKETLVTGWWTCMQRVRYLLLHSWLGSSHWLCICNDIIWRVGCWVALLCE